MKYAGELAALGTALCWATGSNLFASAAYRMGPTVLNRLRLAVAMVFLSSALWVSRGSPWPTWATAEQIALLAASGLVGFAFGDAWYFRAMVILGPGRASLLASVAPLFTAILAWPILGERPGPMAWAGTALILAGVGWVLWGRQQAEPRDATSSVALLRDETASVALLRDETASVALRVEGSVMVGVGAGVLAALGQAGGYVISKLALRTGLDPLSATVVRVAAAAASVWLIAGMRGEVPHALGALRDRRAAAFMVAGSFAGPFLGVTLSLTALAYIEAGVAASITAIFPLLAILIAARFHRETLTWRSFLGASVAVAGVVVLFLR